MMEPQWIQLILNAQDQRRCVTCLILLPHHLQPLPPKSPQPLLLTPILMDALNMEKCCPIPTIAICIMFASTTKMELGMQEFSIAEIMPLIPTFHLAWIQTFLEMNYFVEINDRYFLFCIRDQRLGYLYF